MTDEDYWKDRYEELWGTAAAREDKVKELIEKETGKELKSIGLGTGSTEYISGSAKKHGFQRGGADYEAVGTNIHIEITGPTTKKISRDEPLWVRPDKIEAAKANSPDIETWVVHHLPKDDLLRVICLDSGFFERQDDEFNIIEVTIRGSLERYVEIPASSDCVRPFEELIERIKSDD